MTIACLLFLAFAIKTSASKTEWLGYLSVAAGAIGNLIDRIFRGCVIDFLDVDFFDIHIKHFWIFDEIQMDRWPIFNLADSFICIGVGMVMLALLFESTDKKKDPLKVP